MTAQLTANTAGDDAPLAGSGLGLPAPNPFRDAAEVPLSIEAPGRARVSVLDVLGREVAVLLDADMAAGEHAVSVDGRGLAPGVYVVRLEHAGRVSTRRLTRTR